jgi:hypothetical protein
MFENWEMTEICGPNRGSNRRKLYSDEIFNFYSSPNNIQMIKRRKWDGQSMWHAWGRRDVHTGFC